VAGFIPARKGLDAEGGKKEVEKLRSWEAMKLGMMRLRGAVPL